MESKRKAEGFRHNVGKPRWSLVPQSALIPMVRVLEYGEQKYTVTDHNENLLRFAKFVQEGYLQPILGRITFCKKENTNCQNTVKLRLECGSGTDEQVLQQALKEQCGIHINLAASKGIATPLQEQLGERVLQVQTVSDEDANAGLLFRVGNGETLSIHVKGKQETIAADAFVLLHAIAMLPTPQHAYQQLLKGVTISGRDNWKRGLPVTQICESLKRHLDAFMEGEDDDPESGLNHVGHIQANAMFLGWMLEHRPDLDDRETCETTTDGEYQP